MLLYNVLHIHEMDVNHIIPLGFISMSHERSYWNDENDRRPDDHYIAGNTQH